MRGPIEYCRKHGFDELANLGDCPCGKRCGTVFGSSPLRSGEIAAGEVFYMGATTMATEAAIDKELNLQGEVCPYTFVKSKLALEIMQPGQVLRVTVDNDESAANVPRSMQNEGHNVLGVTKLNDKDWQIVVRKS